jgi:hypothetical protein
MIKRNVWRVFLLCIVCIQLYSVKTALVTDARQADVTKITRTKKEEAFSGPQKENLKMRKSWLRKGFLSSNFTALLWLLAQQAKSRLRETVKPGAA